MGSFLSNRDEYLRSELREIARNGPRQSQAERERDAEQRWKLVRHKRMLALVAILPLQVLPLCTMGNAAYVIMGILMLGCFGLLFKFNREHRAAFVAWQMAKGVSETDAKRECDRKFGD